MMFIIFSERLRNKYLSLSRNLCRSDTGQSNDQNCVVKTRYIYGGKGGHKMFQNLQKWLLYRRGRTYRAVSVAEHSLFYFRGKHTSKCHKKVIFNNNNKNK
jgi:hypothetical protein